VTALAMKAARRTSSNISRSLLEAGPSVPMPTFSPASSILVTGAKPEASLRFEDGLCATPLRHAEGPYFTGINVNAMRGDDFGFQQALLFDVRHHRHPVLAAHIFNFKGGLCDVNMQGYVEFHGKLAASCRISGVVV